MAVIIGSARCDENGQIHGGKAGDQTGREVSTQAWYQHRKGWVVARPKDEKVAEKIARAMQAACDNPNIGYDQWNNQGLYKASKDVGFDPAKVTTPTECDCARLVRVCVLYAGVEADDFYTGNCISVLRKTGAFTILTGSKYTTQSAYLRRGDILCTRTRGHVVVCLTDGANVSRPHTYTGALTLPTKGYIEKGDRGVHVRRLQSFLNWFGKYDLDVDGIFGEYTETAVESFQRKTGLVVDGVFGKKSIAKAKTVKR